MLSSQRILRFRCPGVVALIVSLSPNNYHLSAKCVHNITFSYVVDECLSAFCSTYSLIFLSFQETRNSCLKRIYSILSVLFMVQLSQPWDATGQTRIVTVCSNFTLMLTRTILRKLPTAVCHSEISRIFCSQQE